MSCIGAAPRPAVTAPGARTPAVASKSKTRASAPASNARAEASRKNGAKSRGPKTPEGKARSSKNALKHGLRALRHVVLPQEDPDAFDAFQMLLFEELAPEGVLQVVLARRVVVAAWRLARADRMEAEVIDFRSYERADSGLALIRDGNSTRTVETLVRYRNGTMAELTRALRTLKALQAEHAAEASVRAAPDEAEVGAAPDEAGPRPAPRSGRDDPEAHPQVPDADAPNEPAAAAEIADPRAPNEPAAAAEIAACDAPNGPERRESSCEQRPAYVLPEPPAGRTLHEPAASWTPSEPEPGRDRHQVTEVFPTHAPCG